MEDVYKTGVRDQQLDQEIPENDIILLSEKFPHLLSVHKVGSTSKLYIRNLSSWHFGEKRNGVHVYGGVDDMYLEGSWYAPQEFVYCPLLC